MSPKDSHQVQNGVQPPQGPHPSFIQLAKPYVFEQGLQQCMTDIGATEAKEDTLRLQGVTWIDSVRKALQLPVRTYNTACVYYHKFRLIHPDNDYDYRDAAAAALFNACKIEDTLKKSRDILCTAYNLRLPAGERLSSDDQLFETHSKTIVGLERLMLEASGFDFRNRYPQKMLMKLVKSCSLDRDKAGMTAYKICLDLYRTFVPLKQTTQTMALACLELAIRLGDIDLATVTTKYGFDYERWATTREEIMETMSDVLDLYTHHRLATLIGPEYPLDKFIAVRIELNREATESRIPRYTEWHDSPADDKPATNGKAANGNSHSSATISPQSPGTRSTVGERGREGTVRFMLDPTRARDEKTQVKEYFEPPREVEEWIEVSSEDTNNKPPIAPNRSKPSSVEAVPDLSPSNRHSNAPDRILQVYVDSRIDQRALEEEYDKKLSDLNRELEELIERRNRKRKLDTDSSNYQDRPSTPSGWPLTNDNRATQEGVALMPSFAPPPLYTDVSKKDQISNLLSAIAGLTSGDFPPLQGHTSVGPLAHGPVGAEHGPGTHISGQGDLTSSEPASRRSATKDTDSRGLSPQEYTPPDSMHPDRRPRLTSTPIAHATPVLSHISPHGGQQRKRKQPQQPNPNEMPLGVRTSPVIGQEQPLLLASQTMSSANHDNPTPAPPGQSDRQRFSRASLESSSKSENLTPTDTSGSRARKILAHISSSPAYARNQTDQNPHTYPPSSQMNDLRPGSRQLHGYRDHADSYKPEVHRGNGPPGIHMSRGNGGDMYRPAPERRSSPDIAHGRRSGEFRIKGQGGSSGGDQSSQGGAGHQTGAGGHSRNGYPS